MLHLNRIFYLIHYIEDLSFQREWYLRNVRLFYQSLGLTMNMNENEIDFITR